MEERTVVPLYTALGARGKYTTPLASSSALSGAVLTRGLVICSMGHPTSLHGNYCTSTTPMAS